MLEPRSRSYRCRATTLSDTEDCAFLSLRSPHRSLECKRKGQVEEEMFLVSHPFVCR